jgi:repressor LexA
VNIKALTATEGNTKHLFSMTELTSPQRRVFDFVREKLLNGHPAPSMREMSKRFGWSSSRASSDHINALIRKGWLLAERGKARSLRLANYPKSLSRAVEIPIFGTIPAGSPAGRQQEAKGCASIDIEALGTKPSALAFGLEVKGDSMIGRHIAPGDLVVIEPRSNAKNGDVVAALIDGESTLKTLVVRGNKTYLRAENPKYPDLTPADELVIQGVAITVVRKLR